MRGKHKNTREHKLRKQQLEKEEQDKHFQLKNAENEKKIKQKGNASPKKAVVQSSFNPQKPQAQTSKGVTKNSENKKGYIEQYLPKTATSKFILVFSALLVLSTVLYISDLIINKKDYEGYTPYYDENLNFSVDIPSKWAVGVPEEDSVKEIVKETTGGLTFDTRYATLSKELVPLSLIQQDPTGKYPYKSMMIVSMFGHESPSTYMNDRDTMEEEFKSILQELGHEGIKIEKVEDAYDGYLNGVLLYAKSYFEGKKMYYLHYTERLDKNVLRILYGSKDAIKKPKELEEFMSTFTLEETNLVEQLLEQGFTPEELENGSSIEPSEDDHAGHNHAEDDHAGHNHAEDDHAGHNHAEEEPKGGVVNQNEHGQIELDFVPNFEVEGDIEASESEK